MPTRHASRPARQPSRLTGSVIALGLFVLLLSGCSVYPAGHPRLAMAPHMHSRLHGQGQGHRHATTRGAGHLKTRRRAQPVPRPKPSRPGVPHADLPDRRLTPGVVLTTSTARICTPGYAASVRDVPTSESDAVYARYHVEHVPYAHEVDHLVSLELGGANAIGNLWPEPYAGRWGARTKDALENRLHDLVCSGALSLPTAQHLEATDWVAAYRRFVGQPPVVLKPRPRPATTATRSAGGSCEPGYSPCLPVTSDLNCADIPDSEKPVHVTGSDPYRLDGDGDGLGCE